MKIIISKVNGNVKNSPSSIRLLIELIRSSMSVIKGTFGRLVRVVATSRNLNKKAPVIAGAFLLGLRASEVNDQSCDKKNDGEDECTNHP